MLSAALLAVGCSDMAGLPSDDAEDIAGVQKICNVASSQSGTVLMVYASDDVEAVIAAAGAVSGVLHVTPLFNMETGDVELKRRLGLDRWLAVEFAEDYDVEAGAAALASLACVSSVEFNASVERCSDWRSWPYEPGPATRAIAAAGFNDPYRVDQWGFENTGDKGWCPTARVGADINVSRAWSLCAGNPEVVVAVIATIPTLPQTSGRIPERLPATERTTTGTATGTTSTAIISSMELRTSTGKATGTADTELTWPEPLLRSITMESVSAASPAAAGAEMELRLCPARYSTKERAPSAAS